MSPPASPKKEAPTLATTADGWIEEAPSAAAAKPAEEDAAAAAAPPTPAPSSPKTDAAPADRGVSSLASRIGGLTTESEEDKKPETEVKAPEGECS